MTPMQLLQEQHAPQEQAPPEQTCDMLKALDDLAHLAEDTMNRVCGGVDDAPLTRIVDALELLTSNVEVLHQMMTAVNRRAKQIREREVTERRDGTGLETMDSALVTLSYGQETAMVMHHLLSMGRRDLVRVDADEVI